MPDKKESESSLYFFIYRELLPHLSSPYLVLAHQLTRIEIYFFATYSLPPTPLCLVSRLNVSLWIWQGFCDITIIFPLLIFSFFVCVCASRIHRGEMLSYGKSLKYNFLCASCDWCRGERAPRRCSKISMSMCVVGGGGGRMLVAMKGKNKAK